MTDDQLILALADRHEGQQACLAAAETGHRDDRGRVEAALAHLIDRGQPFTADTVHDLITRDGDGETYNRNVVSSAMGQAALKGLIVEDTTHRPVASRNRSRRASRNRWWIANHAPEGDAA